MADEFTFIGNVVDNAPTAGQKGRADRRMVKESVSNLVLGSGEEYVLLDAKERGDLYEVRVVSDNPYLEVYIELDEYRNENVSAAELLAQPQTGRLLSNFQAIDGGSPAAGYTLLYNPDIPEDYQGRIRVILRNRIRPSKDVFGNPSVGHGKYRSRGDLATPINLGFSGGVVIPHTFAPSDSEALTSVAYTIATGDYFNNLPGLFNRELLGPTAAGVKRGALHPYVGTAGIPILNDDNTIAHSPNTPMNNTLHVFFDDVSVDPTAVPADGLSWPRNTQQDIYIADFAGAVLSQGSLIAGERVWFKTKTEIYFPGVVDSVTDSVTLPTRFASNGGTAYTNCLKITVKPGLAAAPPPMVFANYEAQVRTGELEPSGHAFGTLTTGADTNPKVLVYGAELRRLKRISYDG